MPETPRTPRAVLAAAAIIIAAVYSFSFVVSPDRPDIDRGICVLKAGTGVPCPLCGMSRAFIRASHGDLAGAFEMHPLFPLLYLGGAALFAVIVGEIAGATRLTARLFPGPLRSVALLCAVFAAFWVVRLAHLWHSGALAAAFGASPLGRALGR